MNEIRHQCIIFHNFSKSEINYETDHYMVQTFKNKNLRSKSIDFTDIDYEDFKQRYTINTTRNKLSNFLDSINLEDTIQN